MSKICKVCGKEIQAGEPTKEIGVFFKKEAHKLCYEIWLTKFYALYAIGASAGSHRH